MQCLEPLSIRRPNGKGAADRITVPCGQCAACQTNRRNEWSIRLQQELRDSCSAQFVTLTYSDDNIPIREVVDQETGDVRYVPVVLKDEMQRYMKRLRKLLKHVKFRYYLVGEYGTHTCRPHYHILGFGVPSDMIDCYAAAWQDKGHIKIGSVTEQSIMYVSKYHVNKTNYPEGAEPSFVLMSRNPGIGYQYVDRMYDYHNPYNDRTYYPDNGSKRRLPRYYKERLWTPEERVHLKYHIPQDSRSAEEIMDQAVDYTRRFRQKSKLNNKF